MFSMCSELTPRAPIPDTRIPQLMQPWAWLGDKHLTKSAPKQVGDAVGNHFLVTFHVLGARRVYVAICQSLWCGRRQEGMRWS